MLTRTRLITAAILCAACIVGAREGRSFQQSASVPVSVAGMVKKLGVDATGLSPDLLNRSFRSAPELGVDGLVGMAGWLNDGDETLLVAIRRTGEPWRATTLPAQSSSPITQLGSPLRLTTQGEFVLLATHLTPSAGTTAVLRASDLSEVRRIAGGVAVTIPPSIVVFGRSMVHFAPAHPGSLGVFDRVWRRIATAPGGQFTILARAGVVLHTGEESLQGSTAADLSCLGKGERAKSVRLRPRLVRHFAHRIRVRQSCGSADVHRNDVIEPPRFNRAADNLSGHRGLRADAESAAGLQGTSVGSVLLASWSTVGS
jgi:hypothetical protein